MCLAGQPAGRNGAACRGDAEASAGRRPRAVGWIIIGLSLGRAGYALASKPGWVRELSDLRFTLVGAVMAGVMVAALLTETRRRHGPEQEAA